METNGSKPNTLVVYSYRDASNYKSTTAVVLEGSLSESQAKTVLEACEPDGDDAMFVPEALGLPLNLPGKYNPDVDHPWAYFSIKSRENFIPTTAPAETGITTERLVELFESSKGNWQRLADEEEFERACE